METFTEILARAIAENCDGNKQQAARELRVTPQTLRNWLRGQRPSTPEHLDALSAFTGESRGAILVATGWAHPGDLSGSGVTDAQPLHFPALAGLVPA
jgi:hypothetical protein